jgi:hypothetical protein
VLMLGYGVWAFYRRPELRNLEEYDVRDLPVL